MLVNTAVSFLEQRFPELARRYREQYERSPYLSADYNERLRARVSKVREKYNLASAPVEYRPELWEDDRQLALFPL